jgi:hypothetical protein
LPTTYLDIVSRRLGRLTTILYDKLDDFNVFITFPFLCSNILSIAYSVYISQLIRCVRVRFAYEKFSKRGKLQTKDLMLYGYNNQISFKVTKFCKYYSHYNDLVCDYKLSLAHLWYDLIVSYSLLGHHFYTSFDDE